MPSTDIPIKLFKDSASWEAWLEKNHETSSAVWVRFAKKNSGLQSINYSEALDVALCYGWIDSLVNKYDDKSYIQKFTPRRSRSLWSKLNREHIARLIKEGRMKQAGIQEVERAKKDGRWDSAYNSPSTFVMPKDFLQELAKDKKAEAFFKTLNKANTYAIAWRLQTAKKPETRERRMRKLLEMMERGEKLY